MVMVHSPIKCLILSFHCRLHSHVINNTGQKKPLRCYAPKLIGEHFFFTFNDTIAHYTVSPVQSLLHNVSVSFTFNYFIDYVCAYQARAMP